MTRPAPEPSRAVHRKPPSSFVHQPVVVAAGRHQVGQDRPPASGDEHDVVDVEVAAAGTTGPPAAAVPGEDGPAQADRDLPGPAVGHDGAVGPESERCRRRISGQPLGRVRGDRPGVLDGGEALRASVGEHRLVHVHQDRRRRTAARVLGCGSAETLLAQGDESFRSGGKGIERFRGNDAALPCRLATRTGSAPFGGRTARLTRAGVAGVRRGASSASLRAPARQDPRAPARRRRGSAGSPRSPPARWRRPRATGRALITTEPSRSLQVRR